MTTELCEICSKSKLLERVVHCRYSNGIVYVNPITATHCVCPGGVCDTYHLLPSVCGCGDCKPVTVPNPEDKDGGITFCTNCGGRVFPTNEDNRLTDIGHAKMMQRFGCSQL